MSGWYKIWLNAGKAISAVAKYECALEKKNAKKHNLNKLWKLDGIIWKLPVKLAEKIWKLSQNSSIKLQLGTIQVKCI